jgi:predicted negative regulator of RcsB-dependent stress response
MAKQNTQQDSWAAWEKTIQAAIKDVISNAPKGVKFGKYEKELMRYGALAMLQQIKREVDAGALDQIATTE